MKRNLFQKLFFVGTIVAFFIAVLPACKEDNNSATEQADTTKLVALLDSCQTLLDEATTDDYPESAITTFQSIVTTARTAISSSAVTQTVVDNLVVQVRAAKETFLAAAYDAIPTSALILGISFDETVSNSQFTTEGKGWTAVLKSGPSEIFGTATNLPSFVTGKSGNAMYFSNGAHLEISDYAANDLMGNKMSIAVWVNPDSTRAGNYIASYNYWKTWKFQLQAQNKPFFTVSTTKGVTDADNQSDFSAPNKTWTHLVVTLDLAAETMSFYVNGVNTMTWTTNEKPDLTGALTSYSNTLPLMIGACTTYAEAKAAWDWSWAETPANWDSFIGSMDEFKVYNIALTDGQVAKLYKEEK
ncbi:MAG: LamG domain-containing protein [Paludibacter sp.]|nr:LamG domain-containing protein [Paludibacter sp.]